MKRFYKTKVEFNAIYETLKQQTCPHCRYRGFLILHGYLYGYSEGYDHNRIKRGHRIFCSNRKKKKGCGRTFSILKAHIIKNFMISANTLWEYFLHVKDGLSLAKAFRESGSKMVETTIYRIFKKLRYQQPLIRTFLTRVKPPPQITHTKDPAILTLLHLSHVFKGFNCPISQFQHYFQTPFI